MTELTIDKSSLKWWENILFFLGSPKRAYDGACCKCKVTGLLIDLGDGDRICKSCWDSHLPSEYPSPLTKE